jgi:nucleoid-associated protein YgaU
MHLEQNQLKSLSHRTDCKNLGTLILATRDELIRSEPRIMNRQVIPSLLLSVLIVCFFAIILFEREPQPAASDHKPSAPGRLNGSLHQSSPTQESLASSKRANRPAQLAEKPDAHRQSSGSMVRPTLAPGRTDPHSSPAVGVDVTSREPQRSAATPFRNPSTPALAKTVDVASTPHSTSTLSTSTVGPAPSLAPRPCRPAAFTVVEKGETLEDVSIRVYGSSDHVLTLWRANRDLLPRQDSVLAAGSLLRTPDEPE